MQNGSSSSTSNNNKINNSETDTERCVAEAHNRLRNDTIPTERHILLGRGRSRLRHPANVWFSELIERSYPMYSREDSVYGKRYMVWQLLLRILTEQAGFLRWEDGKWTRIPIEDQRQKVMHALQYRIREVRKEGKGGRQLLLGAESTTTTTTTRTTSTGNNAPASPTVTPRTATVAAGASARRTRIRADDKPSSSSLPPSRTQHNNTNPNPTPPHLISADDEHGQNNNNNDDPFWVMMRLPRPRKRYFQAVSSSWELSHNIT